MAATGQRSKRAKDFTLQGLVEEIAAERGLKVDHPLGKAPFDCEAISSSPSQKRWRPAVRRTAELLTPL